MYEANRPIPLGEVSIEFTIDGRSVATLAKAVQNLFPSPAIVLKVSDVPREPWSAKPVPEQPGVIRRSAPMTSEGPLVIKLENGIKLDVVPLAWVAIQRDAILHLEQSSCVVLQTDTPIKSMQFSVLNFSWSAPTSQLVLQAPPWEVQIDPVPNITELKRTLKTDHGYAVTHQGTIKRLDGNAFPVEEATDLLDGLNHFLSFVCGSHCSLTNVIGIDSGATEAWKRWGSHHVSPWNRHRSWLDITICDAAASIFPGFWREYKKNKKSLGRVLELYAHSNDINSIDVSIILTQTALESLSYLTVGPKSTKKGEKEKTGEWIARALEKVKIAPIVPSQCKQLEKFRAQQKLEHGPHVLVKIRNSMIHAKVTDGDIPLDAYHEACQLGLQYLELMLLQRFGHTGEYASRLGSVQIAGLTERVPWA